MNIFIQYFILIAIHLFLIVYKNIQNGYALHMFEQNLEQRRIELMFMKIQDMDMELPDNLYYFENNGKIEVRTPID
jgi:hypothetical protein